MLGKVVEGLSDGRWENVVSVGNGVERKDLRGYGLLEV